MHTEWRMRPFHFHLFLVFMLYVEKPVPAGLLPTVHLGTGQVGTEGIGVLTSVRQSGKVGKGRA